MEEVSIIGIDLAKRGLRIAGRGKPAWFASRRTPWGDPVRGPLTRR